MTLGFKAPDFVVFAGALAVLAVLSTRLGALNGKLLFFGTSDVAREGIVWVDSGKRRFRYVIGVVVIVPSYCRGSYCRFVFRPRRRTR